MRGVDPVHQTHLGQASSLTNDESELGETNLEGIDAHRISHVPADQVESMEIPMDHHNGRVKRSKNSGYVRFGKRFSPLIEGVQGQHRLISDSNDDRFENTTFSRYMKILQSYSSKATQIYSNNLMFFMN